MNRYHDTNIWRKKWFRLLPTEYKLFWTFLLDDCDNAGIWEEDVDLYNTMVNCAICGKTALNLFNGRVIPIDNEEKWFIPKFVEFQQKKSISDLNPENNAHKQIILRLDKYGLRAESGADKPLISPLGIGIGNGKGNGKGKKTPAKKTLSLQAKKINFTNSVHDYLETDEGKNFAPKLVVEFISYWTEPNQARTKLAFEMEKKWSLSRRLGTWKKNDYDGLQAEFDAEVKRKVDRAIQQAENIALQDNSASDEEKKAILDMANLGRKFSV